jgi:hypothetical protein
MAEVEIRERLRETRERVRSHLREAWRYHHPKSTALLGMFVMFAVAGLLSGEPGLALLMLSVAALIAYGMYYSEQRWRAEP